MKTVMDDVPNDSPLMHKLLHQCPMIVQNVTNFVGAATN